MARSLAVVVASLIIGLAGAGCSKKQQAQGEVPTCAQITEHVYKVTRIAFPGHGDMEMGNRKSDIKECEARNVSATERRCIMAAKDMAGVAACRGNKPKS